MPRARPPVPPAFVSLAAHPLRWQVLTELARSDLQVGELAARVREPQNLVSYHLRLLRDAGLVTARRSGADARYSYYRLDLDACSRALRSSAAAIHPVLLDFANGSARPPVGEPAFRISVLFACTGNSARSPIAAALLQGRSGGRIEATSAGSHPKPEMHPLAVRALRERHGIDIADQKPRHLETLSGRRFDYAVTVCDKVREVFPDLPGQPNRMHWSVPDPAAPHDVDRTDYEEFLQVTADIDTRVRHLFAVLIPQEVQP